MDQLLLENNLNHVPLCPNPGIQTHLHCPLTLSNCGVISEIQYRSRQAVPLGDRGVGSWLTVEDVIYRARKIRLAAEAFWQVQALVVEL